MGARGYEEDEEAEEYEEEEEEPEEEPEGEDLADEEEEEEEDQRSRKRRKSKFTEDDEDDDDDDSARRKRKRSKVAAFIDDTAAEVDSGEEDEMEDEPEDGFFVDNDDREVVENHHRGRVPALLHREEDENMSIENIAKILQERYSGRQASGAYDDAEMTEVEQKALLPSVKDPKLWMLNCPQGHEREAVACLMQKYLDMQARGEPLQIKSAVAIDHLKGFIYVEAERETYVRKAIKGLRNIFQKNVRLVPTKEMAEVLTVEKKSVDIDKENWVRVKSGLYKGDLARVIDVDHVRQRAKIKLVPRIDLAEVVAKLDGREFNRPRGYNVRPPQRFINLQEVKELKIPVERKRDNIRGNTYDQFAGYQFLNGHLVKFFSLKTLTPVEAMPSLDELQNFQRPGGDEDVEALASTNAKKKCPFVKGDTVVVVEGDLKYLMGTVEKVDEDHVEMRPKDSELKDVLKFHVKQLSKFFKTGDHVKVLSGKHAGATGMIVMIQGDWVNILSDTTKEDIRVSKNSIVESSEVTSGLTRLGEFELHDLIQLDSTTVGVIVRIEADGCQVLRGTPDKQDVVTVKQRDLRKRFNNQAKTQDRDGNAIGVKDMVRVVAGPFKGKQGPVEHLSRGILFIQDRQHLDNGGFICVRADSCAVFGGSRGDKSLASTFSALKPPSQYLQSPRRSPIRGSYGPPNGFMAKPGPGRRQDTLIGRIVKIRLGPYKGYRGRVKGANDGVVRVELESQMKVVSVRRDQLSDVGDTPSISSSYRETSRYGTGSETPMHPSRTPMHSAFMTPMRDFTATPLHEGMRTPMRDRAWNPTTPLRDPGAEDLGWGNSGPSPPPGTPIASRSYEAPTPGSGWANSPVDSTSPAESGNYSNPSSPYLPSTPGGLPMTPAVPSSYLPGTPGGQPMTPGGVLDPTSPAVFNAHESERQWGLPDLVVLLKRNGETKEGVIREVLPDGFCRVALNDGDVVTVSHSEMEMAQPNKNDMVKIVSGEFRGCCGRLIGIDGADGIVRVEGLDVKIVDMSTLGKT